MNIWSVVRGDVLLKNVGTEEQLKSLLGQALDASQTIESMPNSGNGCWRSDFRYNDIDWLVQEVTSSVNTAMQFYLKEDTSYAYRVKPKHSQMDYWTNVNDKGSSNRLHTHKDYDFVAVYYIQGEGTGDLTFHNPANLLTDCNPNSPFVSRMSYQPKDGDLLLWPAWIPHEVEVNYSDRQRINIAFNIKL